MTRGMRDRLRRVAKGTPGRKKAKKPIAVRGKKTTKAKLMDQMRKRLRAVTPAQIKGKGMSPGMKKAVTGSAVGMSGAGLMALARKLKPTGRLNAADMERVKKMMGKKSGGAPGANKLVRKAFDMPFGKKPVFDSQGNPVKNLFQKDDRLKRPKRSPGRPKVGIKPLPRKRIVGRNIGKPKK